MNILVTGANGLIGSVLVNALLEAGFNVTAQIRHDNNRIFGEHTHVRYIVIENIGSTTDWTGILDDIDVVVHTAAYVHTMKYTAASELECYDVNVAGTEKLALAALKAGVGKFVFLSSITVHAMQEDKAKCVTEETEIKPQSVYADSKYQAELILNKLSNAQMQTVIIRPPLTYGPGVKANFIGLIKLVDSGVPLPLAAIQNRRSFLAVWNLVDFILVCIGDEKANNQTFVVSDGHDLSTPELINKIAEHLGKRARLFYMPVWLLGMAARIFNRKAVMERLQGSLCVNNNKACTVLGWSPPVDFDEALKITLQWYKNTKQKKTGK
jgi:UDP-glucose 4-epimerase